MTTECTLDPSVPDWVIEHPKTLAVFQTLGIDYCCGGKSLEFACREPECRLGTRKDSEEFMAKSKSTEAGSSDPIRSVLDEIAGLVDAFCRERLNEEYAVLCRRLVEKLARKRPSPLVSGSPKTWASGIVRTVGWVNFLHDKTQTPHMRLIDIDAGFGISESSGAAKLAAIRKLLKIQQLDPNWTLPSRLDDNPMVWMLQVNGFMMDVRHAPRELQETAFNKGLIPYVSADRHR